MDICELCMCNSEEDNRVEYRGVMWLCEECVKELEKQARLVDEH